MRSKQGLPSLQGEAAGVSAMCAEHQRRVDFVVGEIQGRRPDEAARAAKAGEDEREDHGGTWRTWQEHSYASGACLAQLSWVSHVPRSCGSSRRGKLSPDFR